MDFYGEGRRVLALSYYGSTLGAWLSALVALLAVLIIGFGLRRAIRGRLGRFLSRIPGRFDDIAVQALQATHGIFIVAVALFTALQWVKLPASARGVIGVVIVLVVAVQCGLWAQRIMRLLVELWTPHDATGSVSTAGAAFTFIGNLVIWSLVLLAAMQNLGIEISALLAGLGVGGIAAALALQTVLGDLFASLSIFTDRPFDLGDFIIVGDFLGNVEKVGLRSTRLKSLGGEQIILPNGDLMKSRIRNYKRMDERRIVTKIGVEYGTPYEKVKALPEILRSTVAEIEGLRFDRAHFAAFGDSSLVIEVVYYVLSPDFTVYMDLQQKFNLEVLRRFEDLGVSFALPTQTLHLRGFPARAEEPCLA